MPYLGNTAGNRFVASKAATQFSGNGSTTAFTLDHAVGSDEDILVSVDGVIQEPSVAYAVSNGTTLTFTAAPSSNAGNNIFVYYLFRTVATVDHPSTSSLQATDGTFSSTLDVTGATTLTGALTGTTASFSTADNNAQLTLKSTDADGNVGPVLDLQRDSSSPADNDVMGIINFKGENDASEVIDYASINAYILDASDGTEDGRVIHRVYKNGTNINLVDMKSTEVVFNEDGADVDFRVEGDTNTHALFVQAGSNGVGINCDSPNSFNQYADNLVVGTTSGENGITIATGSSNSARFVFSDNTTSSNDAFVGAMEYAHSADFFSFYCGGNQRVVIASDGDITNSTGSYGTISDENLKENISDASSQWDDIKALQVRKYSMKADNLDSADKIGVIAQELEKSGMNGLVSETPLADPDDITKKETVKSVKYSILYMKAIKALQEAMTRIETLEAEVKALKG